MPGNLFVYGTLLDKNTAVSVIGRCPKGEKDALLNHSVTVIADGSDGARYPAAIRSQSDSIISGQVIQVTKQELQLLDEYEGPNYLRQNVVLKSGRHVWCYKYVNSL